MPGCNIETLQLFIYWLKVHDLPSSGIALEKFPRGSQKRHDFVTAHQLRLIRVWTFAAYALISRLQNSAVSALLALNSYARAESIYLIFTTTMESSPLRKWALRTFMSGHPEPGNCSTPRLTLENLNHINTAPGWMSSCFKAAAESRCGSMWCACQPGCFDVGSSGDYLVCVNAARK